jgi:hypothetical protein
MVKQTKTNNKNKRTNAPNVEVASVSLPPKVENDQIQAPFNAFGNPIVNHLE